MTTCRDYEPVRERNVAVHGSQSNSFWGYPIEVIFSYSYRETDVTEKFFVRVDVTEEFPFLALGAAGSYQRGSRNPRPPGPPAFWRRYSA